VERKGKRMDHQLPETLAIYRENLGPQYQTAENKEIKRIDLRRYSLKEIMRRVNHINIAINTQYNQPFPKKKEHLRSWYTYQKRWVRIEDTGYVNKCLSTM